MTVVHNAHAALENAGLGACRSVGPVELRGGGAKQHPRRL
jgi:hypothetical protein